MINKFTIMVRLAVSLVLVYFLQSCFYLSDEKEVVEKNIAEPTISRVMSKNAVEQLTYKTFTLEQLKGHWVYVDFWASWCPPCIAGVPWLEEMAYKYGKHITFITINEDTNPKAKTEFIEKLGMTLPVIDDKNGIIMRRFNAKSLPTALIINPDGEIVYQKEGFSLEQQGHYEEIIRSALSL